MADISVTCLEVRTEPTRTRLPGIMRREHLVMWITRNCWQGSNFPCFPEGAFLCSAILPAGGWSGADQGEPGWCVHFIIEIEPQTPPDGAARENSLHLALGFIIFPPTKNWIRPWVELWKRAHLLHDRTAKQSVFKGQRCFFFIFPPSALWFFSPLFIPVRIFFSPWFWVSSLPVTKVASCSLSVNLQTTFNRPCLLSLLLAATITHQTAGILRRILRMMVKCGVAQEF